MPLRVGSTTIVDFDFGRRHAKALVKTNPSNWWSAPSCTEDQENDFREERFQSCCLMMEKMQ